MKDTIWIKRKMKIIHQYIFFINIQPNSVKPIRSAVRPVSPADLIGYETLAQRPQPGTYLWRDVAGKREVRKQGIYLGNYNFLLPILQKYLLQN